jgi:hypothetical protein
MPGHECGRRVGDSTIVHAVHRPALSNGRVVTNPLSTTIRYAFATRGEGQVKAGPRKELNLKFTKNFRFSQYRIELGAGVYNVFNSGTVERHVVVAHQHLALLEVRHRNFAQPEVRR